jgi:hypothetical protein
MPLMPPSTYSLVPCRILIGVARGLQALHSTEEGGAKRPVAFRDLKSEFSGSNASLSTCSVNHSACLPLTPSPLFMIRYAWVMLQRTTYFTPGRWGPTRVRSSCATWDRHMTFQRLAHRL